METLPTIETSRLLLRSVTAEDAPNYHALETDPEVKRFLLRGSSKLSVEDYRSGISKGGLGLANPLAVIIKNTGAFAGRCGFTENFFVEGWEIHIVLARAYQRQGYGTEIGLALIPQGFSALGCNTIFGVMDAANSVIICLCEKLVMKFIRSLIRNGQLQHVYAIEKNS